jgi:type I restriction enzyme, S subunit
MDTDGLPEGWTLTTVGGVSEAIQYGYTASAAQRTNGPRFLRITDIQDGAVDWNNVPSCEIDGKSLSRFALGKGDIVFARTGATTGKSFLIGPCPPAVFASYLIRLRPLPEVLSPFLALFFQTPDYWQLISENVSGNAQPNCNASKLAELPMPLPPPSLSSSASSPRSRRC